MTPGRIEALHGSEPPPDLAGILAEIFRGLPWMRSAECGRRDERGEFVHDPELFHPPMGGSTTPAKSVCAACPVLEECREWAIRTKQPFGVWGGMSVMERRAARRAAR